MNLCDDNRTETIEAAKTALIKETNIEDSPEEMKVLDSILLRCWQMGWLDRLPIDDDVISRKAAIDAVEFGITYAKAINKETGEVTALFEESNAELQKAADRIKQLPPAQPEKRTEERTETHGVCLDTISRQDAIEVAQNRSFMLSKEKVLLINDLEKLPSAEPKTGKWILDRSGGYCCSRCLEPCAGYVMMKPRDKFCKMCGSRNEVTT